MLGARSFREERGSSLQGGERFFLRIEAACNLTGSQIIGNGPLWQTGLFIVGCDLRAGCPLLIGSGVCECLCDTTMEETPMSRTQ